ncbi:S-layer homology domain-containing protein [Rossellomorea aquimaris]|uniref:S-layer homology domain-containing protein n=1 Tax=Rossellomorea aquimaris TaxID=189382 RepID=UPI001CFDD247|nr:S-layer homology domain-containing protein [Rossellomorea aquimaris]
MKRLSAILLVVIMFFSLVSPNVSNAADDITGHYFERDMRILIEKDILGGYGPGEYLPDRQVTRAEFATFVVRALDLNTITTAEVSIAQVSEATQFKDVAPTDWYYSAVLAASNNNLVGGYSDGTFKPNKYISRQEMAAMIMRAMTAKGVLSEKEALEFKDTDQINPIFIDSISRLLYLDVMAGKKDSAGNVFFAPKSNTTRGETAAVINRMLKIVYPPQNLEYKVAAISKGMDPIIVREFDNFDAAKEKARDNQVVLHGNNIVWISNGIAVSNKYTVVYTDTSFTANHTYVTSGVEMKYFDAGKDWVKVQVADVTGFVKPETVNLTPLNLVEDRSYYQVVGGDLIHQLYNPITKERASYIYGKAPSFMKAGEKYYSWDGDEFYHSSGAYAGKAFQYFNRMPLYTKSSYTGEQLDAFLKHVRPDSLLIGTGDAFKKAEEQYGTNALYFLSHAILESYWGTSRIAKDKNNLFGIGAVDSDPYGSAWTYDNYEQGILDAASKFIVPGYFNEKDWRFEGEHLGNKGTGMNVRYASDAYWGQKISGLMYQMDQFISKNYGLPSEMNKYNIAETITTSVNVRNMPTVSGSSVLYQIPDEGVTLAVKKEFTDTGMWYQIEPKNVMGKNYPQAFAYSHGYPAYGTSLELMPLAK